ncbi:MAG: NADH-quinone oxidoreductase subunit NuoK [Bacteroidota bacterium]
MNLSRSLLIGLDITAVFALFAIGAYAVISRRNMLKVLIGLETMSKSVLLGFILAGKVTGKLALAQSIVAILIVIDAAIIAIVLALVVNAYRHYGRIDVRRLTRLRG